MRKSRQIHAPYQRAEKLWNMKVKLISIVIGALGTVLQKLKKRLVELEIRGRIKTILITAELKLASKQRRVLEN